MAAKRAASYGRAPVRHDLDAAAMIWAFDSSSVDPELAELRRRAFEGIADPPVSYTHLTLPTKRSSVDLGGRRILKKTDTARTEERNTQ